LRFKPTERSFDLIRHSLYLHSDDADFAICAAQRLDSSILRSSIFGWTVNRSSW
jgi:hypothetical protein